MAPLRGSYTYSRAFDNSSYSCCLLIDGFSNPRVGAFGPNEIGARGDTDRAWGRSNFNRPHTFVFSARTGLPHGLRVSALWRIISGTPWGPQQSGDLNGDGVNFNDRPFIFAPALLPIDPALSAGQRQAHRDRYARYLEEYPCVGDYVGRIVPRNTCLNPVFNRLDATLGFAVPTLRRKSAELVLDLFNVLNLLNPDWGRYEGMTMERRNLLEPRGFVADAVDVTRGTITYRVPTTFGERRELGLNLMLQWQAQLALRYRF